jgi:hypothetical protein
MDPRAGADGRGKRRAVTFLAGGEALARVLKMEQMVPAMFRILKQKGGPRKKLSGIPG